MSCARCGNTNPTKPVAPPVNRPGTQVPRPAQTPQAPCSDAIRNAINNLRYVPK